MKQLLEDLRHELVTLHGLYATDKPEAPELFQLLFSELIARIDKKLEE